MELCMLKSERICTKYSAVVMPFSFVSDLEFDLLISSNSVYTVIFLIAIQLMMIIFLSSKILNLYVIIKINHC